MKQIKFSIIFFLAFLITSCSNDFDLTEDSDPIPVVYGVISHQDTAIYIRVEKSFVSETVSGKDLAQDATNLYFDDIQVVIRHNKTGKEYMMERVDGNQEGYQRAPGAFAEAPNYLYKLKRTEINLIPKDEYQLIVRKNDGSTVCESKTTILAAMTDENSDVPIPSAQSKLSFVYQNPLNVSFFPDPNGVIHDVIFRIHYREVKNGEEVKKSIDWHAGVNVTNKTGSANSQYLFTTVGRNFYQFLAANIPANDPSNPVVRVFDNVDLIIISGNKPIKDYISIGLVNLGITSSGEVPVYSNISNDGRGLFASSSTFIREGMVVSSSTLDSLRRGIYTKQLNFK